MDPILKRLQNEIASAVHGASISELSRSSQQKWNAVQILEHLYLSYAGTVKGLEKCLEARKPQGSVPNFKQRFATFAVTGIGYFPTGRKSPKQAEPRGVPAEEVLAKIGPTITAMDEL